MFNLFIFIYLSIYYSLFIFIYLPLYLSQPVHIYLSASLSQPIHIYLSTSLSITVCSYLSIYLFIYRSLFIFIYLPLYHSLFIFIYLPLYLSQPVHIYLSTSLSITACSYLSVYLSIYHSLFIFIYLPLYLSQPVHIYLSASLSQSVHIYLSFETCCVTALSVGHYYSFISSHFLHNRRQLLFTAVTNSSDKKNVSRLIYTTTNKKIMDSLKEKYNRDPTDAEKEHTRSYEDAVKALNSLQIPNKTFLLLKKDRINSDVYKLGDMRKYIECIGMTVEDQDQLSVIHVAGTKGKGSTCSYVESILRHKGYKTGFFSSPHLKEVRERIRINGSPISHEKFTKYFWYCFDHIQAQCQDILPTFFQFLTILSFYVFWREKVHVCIIEVGLGGRYDCTNIVRKPVVCGLTHLTFDHTDILGETIQSIAQHKAGIFKPGTTAVTSPQSEEALEVLQDNAKEVKCSLYMAPDLSAYEDLKEDSEINDYEKFQKENLSLALQLCRVWLHNFDKDLKKRKWVDTFSGKVIPVLEPLIPDADIVVPAMKSTCWAGRVQILKRQNITYYLDGAHTEDSIKLCCDWFKKKATAEMNDLKPNKNVKILLFNITGKRNPHNMMLHLKDCGFDMAIFTPNVCYPDMVIEDQKKLGHNLNVTKSNQHTWLELHERIPDGEGDICNQAPLPHDVQESKDSTTEIFSSIYEALFWWSKGKDNELCSKKLLTIKDIPFSLKEADHIQVLVTGSVYLVGGVLTIFNSPV
ncbi:FPGS [Acanthosepion pharaonis]|uniref:tetrahydrofolate synthase n=1 Tax=Acanthosepion pharaonis TaxID=158019 RepID=A0A812CGZ1_ACAPH|nr:FPGS [Sepia pharaonis]